jgi:hypothetical protein
LCGCWQNSSEVAQAHIEVQVAISLGLDISISVVDAVLTVMEIVMKNLNAIIYSFEACVWCGIALLRSLVEIPTQMREEFVLTVLPAESER